MRKCVSKYAFRNVSQEIIAQAVTKMDNCDLPIHHARQNVIFGSL